MDKYSRTSQLNRNHRGRVQARLQAAAAMVGIALVAACGYGGDAALVSDEGAILEAIGSYLREQRGINPDAMEMTIGELNLDGDKARALVRFSSKDAPTGMEYEYQLQRIDGAWTVVGSSSTEGSQESLPEGHPPIPAPDAEDASTAVGEADDAS